MLRVACGRCAAILILPFWYVLCFPYTMHLDGRKPLCSVLICMSRHHILPLQISLRRRMRSERHRAPHQIRCVECRAMYQTLSAPQRYMRSFNANKEVVINAPLRRHMTHNMQRTARHKAAESHRATSACRITQHITHNVSQHTAARIQRIIYPHGVPGPREYLQHATCGVQMQHASATCMHSPP